MFNPFALMKFEMLPRFRDQIKRPYLVAQTLRNAPPDPDGKTQILMSDYDDIGLARIHQNSVTKDKYVCLIDLNKEAHYMKVMKMMSPESTYRVYVAFITDKEIEKTVLRKYEANVRNYIKRAGWHIDRNTTFRPAIELVFGEFFVSLKYGTDERKFRLEELEKY